MISATSRLTRLLLAGVVAQSATALASADTMERMTGPAIRSRFSGLNFTDGVHWTFFFEGGGRIRGTSMGKHVDGRWEVKGKNICVMNGPGSDGCFEVWADGSRVELRRDGDLPIEGVLKRE